MSERLVFGPEQRVLPAGYCWCFAHELADGTVRVSVIPQPPTAGAGAMAAAHLDAIRREVETRAAEVIAARGPA